MPPVHLLDSDAQFRADLATCIHRFGFPTCTYATGSEFLLEVNEHTPGILLLELTLRDMSGIEVLETLAQRDISPPAIVLTAHADVRQVVRSFQTQRVAAFLQKQNLYDAELLAALRKAQEQAARERADYERQLELRRCLTQLPPAEIDVLNLLRQGKGTRCIANTLGLSRRTVQARRAAIARTFRGADHTNSFAWAWEEARLEPLSAHTNRVTVRDRQAL